ncbi:DUF2840 domain-containing protein [Brevundimonas sp.]|uniref:DUF2840 domain-containing protein n=1 Tax=Brevundimonas sp. TaxID=1871086 RepID=UPI001AD31D41|nr:DUF2840 domain-containing protein [Brevundimonas sp.]MBN9466292.1 DUF2840 domain-containing protein [Brevundimonas sp.]
MAASHDKPAAAPSYLVHHREPVVVTRAEDGGPDTLTWVELVFDPGRTERWIRFGEAADQRIVSRRNRFVGFRPGAVFAFVRWAAGEHGTVVSRLDILQAADPSRDRIAIPGVVPGAVSLLRLNGWPRVKRALEVIDAVEAGGFDGAAVAPDYWRHVHARLGVSLTPLPYTLGRHRAFHLRQQVTS